MYLSHLLPLKIALAAKTEEYEALSKRTGLLQVRIQELNKALVSMEKMKKDINADIEELQ